jgi:hypothetical protein
MGLLNIGEPGELQRVHAEWVEEALKVECVRHWSKSLAVGSEDFVNRIQSALGIKARFFLMNAWPDSYYEGTTRAALAISVGEREWYTAICSSLDDPVEFDRRINEK